MTDSRVVLRDVLAGILRPAGFAGGPSTWVRRNEETVEVVNLQKSRWGNQFYVNFGIRILALGEAPSPKERECHVRIRVGQLLRTRQRWERLMNFEEAMPEEKRRKVITDLLTKEFMPFADACSSLRGLRRIAKAGKLRNTPIAGVAQSLLGTEGDGAPVRRAATTRRR